MNGISVTQNITTPLTFPKEEGIVKMDATAQTPVEDTSVAKVSFDQKKAQNLEEAANKLFESLNTGLAMKFHEESGEWYAVIENKLTREIVKQVPPEYLLDLHAKIKEMVGVFLDIKI